MTELAPNPSFHPEHPTLQLAWDSVSIGALKKCPQYYKYTIVDGWQSRLTNAHLKFGIIYHAATERYDHARADGMDHEQALLLAVQYALEETWDRELNRPWVSEEPTKTRVTLVRTIVWYLDQFAVDDPLETLILSNGKPAVELSFRLDLGFAPRQAPNSSYLLCGHLDKVATFGGQNVISDKKTTKSTIGQDFFDGFTPDNQFSGYIFAGKIVTGSSISGIIVDGAQVAVNFSRFQRGLVTRTPEQLDEWFTGLQYLLRSAEQYAQANFYPLNEKSCFRCEFRGICSKSPSQREQWLSQHFTKRTWNPLAVRGDV